MKRKKWPTKWPSKLKKFYCELFDSHEWEELRHVRNKDGWFVLYRCKKCRKTKQVQEDIPMITSIWPARLRRTKVKKRREGK